MFLLLLSSMQILYIGIILPQQDKHMNIVDLLNEYTLSIALVYLLACSTETIPADVKYDAAWIPIGLIVINATVQIVGELIWKMYLITKCIQQRNRKKIISGQDLVVNKDLQKVNITDNSEISKLGATLSATTQFDEPGFTGRSQASHRNMIETYRRPAKQWPSTLK